MDPELERILSNLWKLDEEGATDADIEEYLDIEGHTGESLERAVRKARETDAALERLATGGGSAAKIGPYRLDAVGDFLHQAAEGATLGQAQHVAGVGLPGLLRMASAGGPAAAVGQAVATATSPEGQARSAAFQQRTDDLQLLAPDASAAAMAAPFAQLAPAMAGGLGPAVGAIRGVRGLLRSPFVQGAAGGAGGAGLLWRWLQGN